MFQRVSFSKELRLDVAQCLVKSWGRAKGRSWMKQCGKCYFQVLAISQRWAPALTFTLCLIMAFGESLKAFGVTILIKSESSTWARHTEALSVVATREKWNVK